jgi:D-psicose/D-tagatose/L-ribulose 3-epimerase
MHLPGRFATCNEVFQKEDFSAVCHDVRAAGYTGLEIAPFTLADDPATLSQAQRTDLRKLMVNAGLEFVGLHWLLAAPPGLHATARDKSIRQRTWDYVGHFIDLCADLAQSDDGKNGVVVFGSPKQRSSRDGMTSQEATNAYIEGLASVAQHAEQRGVTLLVEPLSPDQTDVVTSLAEAVSIVDQIASPAIQTMFDVHNAIKEQDDHCHLIRKYLPYIKHVHVNELDGREPGMGDYDFDALMRTLSDVGYTGWISLEAFDFSRDAREIITRSINRLKAA